MQITISRQCGGSCDIRHDHVNDNTNSSFYIRKCFHNGGGGVMWSCIHHNAARMCWLSTNTLTQHGNEWVSEAKSTRRKKSSWISLQGDMQLKTPSMVFEPPSFPPFKELTLSISCGAENSPGWCTIAYWSQESQMAFVSTARVLVGFINKPGLIRDTDGCWPMCLLYSHLTSYKER